MIPVYFPAMPDPDNENGHGIIMNLVNYPVICDSDSVCISIGEFLAAGWAGGAFQGIDRRIYIEDDVTREFPVIPAG